MKQGIVYLVGAGPGDAGLITVRGLEVLRQADVVVYDNLANPCLLAEVREDAELIYAGKKADQHTRTQDEINTLLSERAARGLVVVRLKGGDPFLFGRGGEEAGWLVDKGIAWEVVPGVSSAIAVPAYSGIPVTHRSVNGSLHVVTGHENMDGVGPEIDWSLLATSHGTIVTLMGVKNLPEISSQLMSHGMPGDTPVAMIQWGSLAEQRTLVTRLDRAVEDVAAAKIRPPATCVIGKVVHLRDKLAWVEKRPLFGVRVAVTRPRDENDTLAGALRELGAEVLATPTLKVVARDLDDATWPVFEGMLAGKYEWLVFTSRNGAHFFGELLRRQGKDARSLAGCRFAAIGQRTADALSGAGLVADLVVTDTTQEGLARKLGEVRPESVLIARAATARDVLEKELESMGASVAVLPLYDSVPDERGIGRLQQFLERRSVHVITFTSARTFEELAAGSAVPVGELLARTAVAVIGPVTRAAVEKAGLKVDIESARADMEFLAAAIRQWKTQG